MEITYEMMNDKSYRSISYMMGIPREVSTIEDFEKVLERLKNSSEFEIMHFEFEEFPYLEIDYLNEIYEVNLFPVNPDGEDFFRLTHVLEDEVKPIMESELGIMVEMEFKEDVKHSFHFQLKLLSVMIPDMVGVIDYSSEKILSGRWATLAAKSMTPPSPEYLYSVQAISEDEKDGEDDVWLHTHGLNRCGIIELEVLKASKDNYDALVNVINYLAKLFLDKEEIPKEMEPIFIGEEMVVTWERWENAISLYDGLGTTEEDRANHNDPSGVLFAYLSEEDYEMGKLDHIEVFKETIEKNPIFIMTNEETERMKSLATERFGYFKQFIEKEGNAGLIKFGLKVDEKYEDNGYQREHLWFEFEKFEGDDVVGKLINQPYWIDDLNEGDVIKLKIENMTDWILFTNTRITPDSVYLLHENKIVH